MQEGHYLRTCLLVMPVDFSNNCVVEWGNVFDYVDLGTDSLLITPEMADVGTPGQEICTSEQGIGPRGHTRNGPKNLPLDRHQMGWVGKEMGVDFNPRTYSVPMMTTGISRLSNIRPNLLRSLAEGGLRPFSLYSLPTLPYFCSAN